MSITLGIIAATAASTTISMVTRGILNKFTHHVAPSLYSSKSRGGGEQNQLAQMNEEQQQANRLFQERLQNLSFENQKELAFMTSTYSRHTMMMSNIMNFQNALKGKLFDDALRNFPLNIPPLVMLQNAGLSVNSVTGNLVVDDPITKQIFELLKDENIHPDSIYLKYESLMKENPIPLSIFVTPLQIDSRVAGKEKISSIVWDNIYQKLESLIINEYNRSGDRPVIFYPGAWNTNAKPGMHASEILYFFTKGMPVAVLEPRFDGKKMRFMFSCWGVGMMGDEQIRQEISFDMDWDQLVVPVIEERSIRGLDKLKSIDHLPPVLQEIQKRLAHNVNMYEQLQRADSLNSHDLTDDITKLFYVSNNDYSIISEVISDTLGIIMSLIADVHHLTTRGIEPHFSDIKDKYFSETFKYIEPNDLARLNDSFKDVFKSAYAGLLLSDSLLNVDMKEVSKDIDAKFEIQTNVCGIKEQLEQEAMLHDVAKPLVTNLENETSEVTSENIASIPKLVNSFCLEHQIQAKTMRDKINAIKEVDTDFINRIENILKNEGVQSIDEFLG